MSVLRTKSVGTKVTDEEYATLEALACGRSLSEWAREILLRAARQQALDQMLLAEVLALRTILLNLHFAVAARATPTSEQMQALIDRADQDKIRRAQERLVAPSEEAAS